MYGPKGVGALYVRKARSPRAAPAAADGRRRAGEGPPLGDARTCRGSSGSAPRRGSRRDALRDGEPERIAALRDRLLEGLQSRIDGIEVNGALAPRLPGNLHVSIPRAEAETLILSLGGRIAISSGAACAEAGGKGSHVLRALGFTDERIYTALRFGIGRYQHRAPRSTSRSRPLARRRRRARDRSAARRDERVFRGFGAIPRARPKTHHANRMPPSRCCHRVQSVPSHSATKGYPVQGAKFPQGFPQILWTRKRGLR